MIAGFYKAGDRTITRINDRINVSCGLLWQISSTTA